MTNSKSTKSSLLISSISLLLCFAMLLGTTFAWFTDSAVSASNVIKSGNLDIDVQYTLGDKDASGEFVWNKLDNAKDLFQKGLWEPGHTEVVILKIENKGSLALKYSANMNIVSETVGKTKDNKDITLSDILTVSTCTQQYTDANGNVASGADIFPGMAFNGDGGVDGWIGYQSTTTFKAGNVLKNDKQLQPKESDYIAVKVDMAETVGNEANHNGKNVPSINFGINVLATQYTYENDSFGNEYDKDASTDDINTYFKKDDIVLSEDTTEAITVKAQEEVNINLNNQTVGNSVVNNGKTTISNGTIKIADFGIENTGVATVTDVKMEAGSPTDYSNITRGAEAETTYNEVEIVSGGGGVGAADGANVVFNTGSVAVNSTSTSGRYLFYAVGEGTVITINGGEFSFSKTLNQKRAYIYAGEGAKVYVTGGSFGPASTRSGYTAGILGNGTVIITGGTFGFNPSAWVAEGYEAVESNGTWTVAAKN